MRAFLIISGLGFVAWFFKTTAVCREHSGQEKCDTAISSFELYAKYAPPEWKKISRALLAIWMAAFLVVGFTFGWNE